MDKATAIGKIRKCLALAKSSEPHEAAAAMRQAQALIAKFGIEHPEILAADVTEEWVKSSANVRPANYEIKLANMVARGFGCELVFTYGTAPKATKVSGGYSFIGLGATAEVAQYTFTVLRRQLIKAREAYSATVLRRYRKNKVAAADLFCEGWVTAVRSLVGLTEPSPEHIQAIEAYMQANYASTTMREGRAVVPRKGVDNSVHKTLGYIAGKNVQLHQGVGTGAAIGMLE